MTRTEIISRALELNGNSGLTAEAANWLDNILLTIELYLRPSYLQKSVTMSTVNSQYIYPFSDSIWSAAPLTDYSKGMIILSSEPFPIEKHSATSFFARYETEDNWPRIFTIFNEKLYINPTPVTGKLPILTCMYYKNTVLPTAGGDDLLIKSGVPLKYQQVLVYGVAALASIYDNDENQNQLLQLFSRGLVGMLMDTEEAQSIMNLDQAADQIANVLGALGVPQNNISLAAQFAGEFNAAKTSS